MIFDSFSKDLRKAFNTRLWLTSLMAAGVSACAVGLLGLSGWFLTAAAIAGAGGPIAAMAFNYLLPSALIRFFAIARTVLRYGERYLGHSAALRAMAKLRPALLARIVAAAPEDVLILSRGEASSRFIQDVTTLETEWVMQSAPASAAGGVAVAVLLCAWGNPAAAVVLLLFMLAALLAGLRLHRSDKGAKAMSEQVAMGVLKARFYEIMALLPDVRSYDMQAPLLAELAELEGDLRAAKTLSSGKEALSQATTLILTGLCLAAIAALSLGSGLADMALSLLAASMGFEALGGLIRAMALNDGFAAARARIAGVFDLEPSASKTENAGKLDWYGQSFALDRRLRLRIDGPSGSGKTRLIEGLMGLRDAEQSFDRNLFALCPQDAGPLTGTVRENLMMALGNEASNDETEALIWTALTDACLDERVRTLSQGLDTWVGDGGVQLSGGERKRLALARAYLKDAPILVLDEPTEGLDLSTEAQVVERLGKRLRRQKQGLILVSHREGPRRLAKQRLEI